MVTDENGVAVSEPIRKGRYIVKESGATAGYLFEEVALDATVKSDEMTELSASNQPVLVKLRIYKRDADECGGDTAVLDVRGDGVLTGAEFQVLAVEDIVDRQGNVVNSKGGIVVDSIVTEGDGASALTEDLIHPPIMTLSDRPILYRLRLIKTDAQTGKVITLSGASFKLKDADGNYVKQTVYYPTKREIDTFTTDDSGAVTLPETVGWGLYFIEEVKAPEGYLIRDQELAVFVGRDVIRRTACMSWISRFPMIR